jgi:hypothetical protein
VARGGFHECGRLYCWKTAVALPYLLEAALLVAAARALGDVKALHWWIGGSCFQDVIDVRTQQLLLCTSYYTTVSWLSHRQQANGAAAFGGTGRARWESVPTLLGHLLHGNHVGVAVAVAASCSPQIA